MKAEYMLDKMKVNPVSYASAVESVMIWALQGEGRYVCAANVHMTMECHDDTDYENVVNSADLVTPDGMPLVWLLWILGYKSQVRVSGPELTLLLCEEAVHQGVTVGFYGGSPDVVIRLSETLQKMYPGLKVGVSISPPFKPLSDEEMQLDRQRIRDAGVQILFVGLGCPKQEKWMYENRDHLNCVMLGVGAAFDYISGTIKQPPDFLQNHGFGWLHRLVLQPRRLWKRYLKHNPRFIVFALTWLVKRRTRI